jgi:transposase-like protein
VSERNGSRPRVADDDAGDVGLRIDQALYTIAMEAYVYGVSTRSVDDLVAALGAPSGTKKSDVSRICAGPDEMIGAFRTRRLRTKGLPAVHVIC